MAARGSAPSASISSSRSYISLRSYGSSGSSSSTAHRASSFPMSQVRSRSASSTVCSALRSSPAHSCSTCTTCRKLGTLISFRAMARRRLDFPTPFRPTRP